MMSDTQHMKDDQALINPLENICFEGVHLIEASAGTGKTWTLSSLMVRLLAEKYLPRQVIATTFTRAAAAELKSRIRQRLQVLYRTTQLWQKLSGDELQAHQAQLKDPLEHILFAGSIDIEEKTHTFHDLQARLNVVIETLDELFVGTIDSFIQKILREFAFESGEIAPRQIAENKDKYTYQLVHDALRAWVEQQPQVLVDLLVQKSVIKSVDAYLGKIDKTLNFNQAKLKEIACPILNVDAVNQALQALLDIDFEAELQKLSTYYLSDGAEYKYVHANFKSNFTAIFETHLPALLKLPKQDVTILNLSVYRLLNDIFVLFLTKDNKPRKQRFLNGMAQEKVEYYENNPLIQRLSECLVQIQKLEDGLEQFEQYLYYYLSVAVKQKLPHLLFDAQETTFNQQTCSLSDALLLDKGKQLANAVLMRYPLIVVDEFQDTSQEQDNIFKAIWRQKSRLAEGCFIAVGDPKQAIYGFRGGDILTYNNARADISHTLNGNIYRLDKNYRTIPALLDSVNALFLRDTDFGEQINYHHAYPGLETTQMQLLEQGQVDLKPLRILHLDENQKNKEAELVAKKIHHLLDLAQKQQLVIQYNQTETKAICAEDIAVLARSNGELTEIQKELEKCHIQVNRASLQSVFLSPIAQDIGALLDAIQFPDQDKVLKRVLLSPLIGLRLTDVQRFQDQPELFSQHILNFREARQQWLENGFLSAWAFLVTRYQIWQNISRVSGEQAERQIVNCKHLIELLSQRHYVAAGIQHLIQWYQIQLGAPNQREWELERALSNAAGVQLMTIHKSKGLEFKIVFLLKTNPNPKQNNKDKNLAFYQELNSTEERSVNTTKTARVIAMSEKVLTKDQQQENEEKDAAEKARLWYVALTRASLRMYLSVYEDKKAKKGVGKWLFAQDEAFSHPHMLDENVFSLVSGKLTKQKQTQVELFANPYPRQKIYPKMRTSFSALSIHQPHRQLTDQLATRLDENETEQAEDDFDQIQTNLEGTHTMLRESLAWIRQIFPKGTEAGTCLHEILEDIDFQDATHWQKTIRTKINKYNLWIRLIELYQQRAQDAGQNLAYADYMAQLLDDMQSWLKDILATPLNLPLNTLGQLPKVQCLSEFNFYLSLQDQNFDSKKIITLFADYGIALPDLKPALGARWLNGAIDLVFFDGVRYHIGDYKSNFIGSNYQHYHYDALKENMTQASYWLQAAIYLVALHRHLKNAFANYDIEQHLGGAHYLYLRGMHPTEQDCGVQAWYPDKQLILQLDSLLGQKYALLADG